jgi:hypothetical protein
MWSFLAITVHALEFKVLDVKLYTQSLSNYGYRPFTHIPIIKNISRGYNLYMNQIEFYFL